MKAHQLHQAADRLSRSKGISLDAARSELGRRGARKRKVLAQVPVVPPEDRKRVFWWEDFE